jgi:outer membrane immunogenic protein
MFRRVFVFAFAISSSSAWAADWYTSPRERPRAPYYLESPQVWTGGYTGVNAGGAISVGSASFATAPLYDDPLTLAAAGVATTSISTRSGGFVGGLQTGYNWQTGSMLIGLEGDVQFGAGRGKSVKETSAVAALGAIGPFPVAVQGESAAGVSRGLDYLATLRARFGVLAAPSLLLYGTAGIAFGENQFRFAVAQQGAVTVAGFPVLWAEGFGAAVSSTPRAGWTLGAGLEWMFARDWSLKAEYLYFDLGSASATIPLYNGLTYAVSRASVRANGNVIRVGVNYHFR